MEATRHRSIAVRRRPLLAITWRRSSGVTFRRLLACTPQRLLAMTALALGAQGAAAQDDPQPPQTEPVPVPQQPAQDPDTVDQDIVQAALDASPQLEQPDSADVRIIGHVLEPGRLDPNPDRIAQVQLPPGFEIGVFADDLINPRMIAVADDGRVYVTRREVGDVVMLEDTDEDGRADLRRTVANRPDMHGIAIDGDAVYLATVNQLFHAERNDDGSLGELELLVDDLPDGGQHPNRTLTVGPDGALYVSVGSTCNACAETNQESASMLRVEPDGSRRTIFASGLRNTIGFGFHPDSGELYGMDHGIDWLGDNEQREELNHIVRGQDYGWPYIYSDGRFNPQDEPPGGISMQEWASESTEPIGLYVAHSAPMQLTFYTGDQFPEEYRGDAFVAMRGSWNRNPPSGYEVLRIRFDDGEPVAFEAFATGFLTRDGGGWGHIGRLAGIAQAADGSLLLSDDTNGIIYRISRTEGESGGAPSTGPAARLAPTNAGGGRVTILEQQPPAGEQDTPDRVAIDIMGSAAPRLDVSSPAFGDGRPIPNVHAAEQQDISPPLRWQQGPEGTESYVVLVEDPDAADDPPHVHWLAYGIPASVTELPEGVPGVPRLPMPAGMQQGRNDNGATGWSGMKPPVGDDAHAYHFQVFALDTLPDLPHGANRAALLEAMDGRILAAGEVVGTYRR